jgi:hypothetical protein
MALQDGLVSFWKLDENTGDTRIDTVGSNDLTDVNSVVELVGVVGSGAGFTRASSQRLTIVDNDTLDFADESFTIAGWYSIGTKSFILPLVSKWNTIAISGNEYTLFYRSLTDKFRFVVSADGESSVQVADTTGSPTTNQWHFIVVWHDAASDEIGIQLDNGVEDTAAWANGVFPGSGDFNVGFAVIADNSEYHEGRADAIGLWNRVLSSGEKTELYNGGAGQEGPFTTTISNQLLGGYVEGITQESVSGLLLGGLTRGQQFGPSGVLIGGYVLSRVVTGDNLAAVLGGYTRSVAEAASGFVLGGYVNAFPTTSFGNAFIGGISSGLEQSQTAFIGGYTFGHPDYTEFAETHARILVKANSVDTVDQMLDTDAEIVFKAVSEKDFNAQITAFRTDSADFRAQVEAVRFAQAPNVTITNTELLPGSGEAIPSGFPIPNFDPNGARRVQITASGELVDGDRFVHAYIDFAEPFRDGAATFNTSISGFSNPGNVITSDHVYNISGVYQIVARFQDNKGMVGTDVIRLNLASGLTVGIDYPGISISGTPRLGLVPPSLQVSFTTALSGIGSLTSPTDQRLFWNFANRETSKRIAPKTYYNSPGFYAPVARFLYTNPAGIKIWTQDSLRIGFSF